MGQKLPKMAAILDFCPINGQKVKFKKLVIGFVKLHTRKVPTKFQVPNIDGVQMNECTFCT